jgi:hypothetical protein
MNVGKYGSCRVVVDGIAFDSKAEARRYGELKLLYDARRISDLQVHPRFDLVAGVTLDGRRRPPMRYTADFAYWEGGERIVEDVKSPASKTTAYKMRRHMMKYFAGIEVREIG